MDNPKNDSLNGPGLWTLGLLLVALNACQTQAGFEKQLASWNGRPIKDWVAERGGPNWISDAPDGKKLYTWQFGEVRYARAGGASLAGVPGVGATERSYSVCTVTLVVDNDLIKGSRFEGDACVGSAP